MITNWWFIFIFTSRNLCKSLEPWRQKEKRFYSQGKIFLLKFLFDVGKCFHISMGTLLEVNYSSMVGENILSLTLEETFLITREKFLWKKSLFYFYQCCREGDILKNGSQFLGTTSISTQLFSTCMYWTVQVE